MASKPREIKEVWVSCGFTLNTGNYESARIDAGVSIPIAENDDSDDAFKEGWDKVREELKAQVEVIRAKSHSSV